MGKSVNNEYAEGFSGKIGRNLVFRQLKNGEVGMARKPRKKKGPAHIKHLEIRKAFKRAALYEGEIGNTIIIDAEDDFKVARVEVSIHDTNGALLERGNAVIPPFSMDWVYTTTVTATYPARPLRPLPTIHLVTKVSS